jgi:hypothetical protein
MVFAVFFWELQAIDTQVNFSGTWVLDPTKSDVSTPGGGRGIGGILHGTVGIGVGGGYPRGGGYPGGGYPGGNYPGGGYPGGSYPGDVGYPGGGYPGGSSPTGGYPGGGYPGGTYPRGRDENPDKLPPGRNPDGITPYTMVTLVIRQEDQKMEVKHQFQVQGKEQEIVQTFSWQGALNSNPDWMGRGTYTCRTSWEKNKLVNLGSVEISSYDGERDMAVREEYSLADKGKTLLIKIKRQSSQGETTLKRVFTREE